MPNDSVQQSLAVFENSLLLAGGLLLLWLLLNPGSRHRWLGTSRLPAWAISPLEFGVLVVLMLVTGFLCQATAQVLIGNVLKRAADRAGTEIFTYGLSFHGGALVGWLLFRSMRDTWQIGNGAEPALPPPPPCPWGKALFQAAGTVVVSLPVIVVVHHGWTYILRQLGLPDDPQDSILIFSNTKSPAVVAGMFAVACVLAPLNEELLFRAGLFRFCRQWLGRSGAVVLSSAVFGAVHLNWAGFLPLSVLGMALAIAYEATGSIRVPILAHGLFNLMNIVFIVFSDPSGS